MAGKEIERGAREETKRQKGGKKGRRKERKAMGLYAW